MFIIIGQQFVAQMTAILNCKIKPQVTKIVRKIGLDAFTDLTRLDGYKAGG